MREFTDRDITWLDEVREITKRIPDADHLKLDEVSFGADLKRGGTLTLKGHVKSSDVIAEFEDSLRYDGNTVEGRLGTIDRNQREYPYVLDTTVAVVPDVYDLGRSRGRPFREELRKQPAEPAKEQPAEPAKEQPAEPAKEQPAEPAKEQPAEPAKEQPAEPAKEQPAEPAKEQPAEPAKPQPRRTG